MFVVRGQIFPNCSRERRRKFGELLGADAGNTAEFHRGSRIFASHVAQRAIGKNNVGRNGAFVGDFAAQGAELIEERFVALDFAGAFDCFFDFGLEREKNFAAIFQGGAAFVSEFDDVHAFTPPFGYYDRDYPGFEAAKDGT